MYRFVLGIVLAAFPLFVYLLHEHLAPHFLVAGFALLGGLRLASVSWADRTWQWLLLTALAVYCVVVIFTSFTVLKLYPVLINSAAAAYCLYTLRFPPSAIERLSRFMGLAVSRPAVLYMRRLTMVWSVFFVGSGIVAAYTAFAASTAVWALYNGCISYLLIALIFAVEYPVRRAYQRKHGTAQT